MNAQLQDGDTIKLTGDIDVPAPTFSFLDEEGNEIYEFKPIDCFYLHYNITLDLNGYTITGNGTGSGYDAGNPGIVNLYDTSLTIIDSSANKTGVIKNNGDGPTVSTSKTKLTIEGGNIDNVHNFGNSTILIKGGIFHQDVTAWVDSNSTIVNNGDGTWTVTAPSTDITKTKEIDGVEVTFTFDGSTSALQDVTGTGVKYNKTDGNKFSIGDKSYTVSFINDEVSIKEVKLDAHLFENDKDEVKIFATSQEDTINNSGDNVTINAKGDNDSITNSGSNVSIFGGYGDDTIENTASKVTINGYLGNDSITNTGADVLIDGGFGNDEISNTAANVTINAGIGADSIVNSGSNVSISAGAGNDTIYNNAQNVTIGAGEGNDSIYNEKADVLIDARGGNDTITNIGNNVSIFGGYGDDLITNEGESVSINGGGGEDTITSTGDLATIYGGEGRDSIINTGNNVWIDGGTGNDTIVNNGGAATISGGIGNDEITGGSQSDSIFGSFGNDTLNGGAGDDILTGGFGKDIFVYENGNDTITDYAVGEEIRLASNEISSTAFDGKDLVFTIGNGSLTVKNGKGKEITITDSSGNTTKQIYKETGTNAKMFDLIQDNNFVTDEFALDDISEKKFEVTQIQPKETEELKQPEITFTGDK